MHDAKSSEAETEPSMLEALSLRSLTRLSTSALGEISSLTCVVSRSQTRPRRWRCGCAAPRPPPRSLRPPSRTYAPAHARYDSSRDAQVWASKG
eukprot:1386705-Rhodomonas_salina.1